ncbi:MAG: YraN family protein [Thiotrichales bacterium]|nr:YraN family protein [Thiotrichales bacterium]
MDILSHLKSKFIGQQKEQQAVVWLQNQGYHIIEQNYLCKGGKNRRGGEIDLIALQTSENRLVFFEVKYRKSSDFGHPAEMITPQQQQRILRCAQLFLQQNPQYQEYAMQFDVLTFLNNQTAPEHIDNAFGL